MDLAERAKHLVATAESQGIFVRLLGGVALYLLAPSARTHPALIRSYKDIDAVVKARDGGKLTPILQKEGFVPDRRFNALHGETRLLFWDEHDENLQLDVFVGTFQQCHRLELLNGAENMTFTVTPTMLLLTKLQIVQLNEKDIRDIVTMLYDWPLADDDQGINRPVLAQILGNDWGLFTTVNDALDIVSHHISDYLQNGEEQKAWHRLESLQQWIHDCPKTIRFRLREKIGRRMSWYELPEEVKR
ncbi:conserved hypothetical protein [Sulfobacillus acidophilus TPY]|uniref:Nucleotidyltransferase family protein n=1 Tax=Sulfobacillus acidophilus (strain ATCC 700253 / DSM 10332 / NAL) TaxID=679936 RepID=G8TV13_SULAD|nr:conserved hypothetical protein [Sulfobacillus acidophilus TPY]AEW03594.1 hypothetical protein Sulac_0017 [Sulfobacillus acidophilus DSM 10332]